MTRSNRTSWVLSAVSAVALGAFVAAPLFAQTTPLPNPAKGPSANGNGAAQTDPSKHNTVMGSKDIIDTATGPGMTEVSTVVAAIKAADLVDTLKGPGPFTVFAPTNAAFDKLPKGTVEELLKPENKEKLKAILLYHVHSGDAIKAADVKTMSLSTANGKPLMVKTMGDHVMINNAKVVKTDVICTNGVIHWVDTVLMPDAPAAAAEHGGM